MKGPKLTDEELEKLKAGIQIMNRVSENKEVFIPLDSLDVMYKWGKWWNYYLAHLDSKTPKNLF